MNERTCGECMACCAYMPIDAPSEVAKPMLQHCRHLRLSEPEASGFIQYSTERAGPCGIYEKRPEHPCRGYKCSWLQGHGADGDRPDLSGIIADALHGIDGAIECRQLSEAHYFKSQKARETVHRLCRSASKVGLVIDFYAWAKIVAVVGRPL